MRNKKWVCLVAIIVLLAGVAWAWHDLGHHRAAVLAVRSLPEDFPAWFRQGEAAIAHHALNPDVMTRPMAAEALHKAESPEHYCDLELLGQKTLPPDRYAYIELCQQKNIAPQRVGLLPYALIETTQRLAVALAEDRHCPNNPYLQAQSLFYAGLLAHYAADSCMPLHTTIHYDGRSEAPEYKSPKTGIHLKTDALLGKIEYDPAALLKQIHPKPFDDLHAAVTAHLWQVNGLVERLYALEAQLPALNAPLTDQNGELAEFARQRLQDAAQFTASLYLTAWEMSKTIEPPEWHKYPPAGSEEKP